MDKKKSKELYIEQEVLKILQFWGGIAASYGAIIFVLLSFLDHFVTPENYQRFLIYRLVAASLFLIIYFLNKWKISKYFQISIILLGVLMASITVELMIFSFGGHQSIYYAGMLLILIFCLGFLPLFSIRTTILLAAITYLTYFLPIIIFDKITNIQFFINSNVFLLATACIGIVWRYHNDTLVKEKLSLQYDLEQQKKQLEIYSLQLKGMVEERTKELHESEQWHRSLFENATDGIIVLDRNGIIVNANDKACEMHGFTREALIGTHIRLLENDGNKGKAAERMRRILEGESLVFETRHNRKDGSSIYLEISSKAITIGEGLFIQSFYRDVTEKKRIHEHLFQSQKMESIGVLAGGIAHDFNNVLTAILGHTGIIRRSTSLDEKSTRSLGVIEDASRRAGRMISKLLGFARQNKLEITPLNLNDVVYDTVKLLEQVIDKKISLTVELDNRLPLIQGNVNQMEQIIMNFVVNARDALPNGGRITIKTLARTVVKGSPDVPHYVPPGEYVELSVSDTGTGIPEDILNKIFEPFFTTKEPGKGTGLGLSMVYGAVKEHQGYLSVHSEIGVGSVFTAYLPVSRTGAARLTASLTPVSGDETLLIVDDEEEIMNLMREALESHGYTVYGARDSSMALAIFQKKAHDTSLVITDIVMPRMDGKELIRQIKLMNPEVKVLAISGYTKYVAELEEIRDIDGFLKKPFESYYLLSAVRRILDAKTKKVVPV